MRSLEETEGRISYVFIVVVVLSLVVLGRLFFLQVTQAEEYRNAAERQHSISLLSTPRRGAIFFEDKDGRLVPAASTRRMYTLSGNPQKILDPQKTFSILQSIVELDEADFLAKARDKTRSYVVFKKELSKETAALVADMDIPSIWLQEEEKRVYPSSKIGAHVLGFLGFVENEKVGRYGVEQYYEEVLKGTKQSINADDNASILSLGRKLLNLEENGSDLVLTIDPNVQSFAATRIAEVQKEWGAVSAGVLILEPKTGKIVAMEALPGFDPNQYNTVTDYQLFLNPFAQKVFEVGSIFKPLTMTRGMCA